MVVAIHRAAKRATSKVADRGYAPESQVHFLVSPPTLINLRLEMSNFAHGKVVLG